VLPGLGLDLGLPGGAEDDVYDGDGADGGPPQRLLLPLPSVRCESSPLLSPLQISAATRQITSAAFCFPPYLGPGFSAVDGQTWATRKGKRSPSISSRSSAVRPLLLPHLSHSLVPISIRGLLVAQYKLASPSATLQSVTGEGD